MYTPGLSVLFIPDAQEVGLYHIMVNATAWKDGKCADLNIVVNDDAMLVANNPDSISEAQLMMTMLEIVMHHVADALGIEDYVPVAEVVVSDGKASVTLKDQS